MKKNIISSILIFVVIVLVSNLNVYGSSDFSFTATKESSSWNSLDYSAAERHQELVGIYYTSHVNNLEEPVISQLVQKQDAHVSYDELKKLIKEGKILINPNGGHEKLEAMYRRGLEVKKNMLAEGNDGKKVEPVVLIEKGFISVSNSGGSSFLLPHYLIVTAQYDTSSKKIICTPHRLFGGSGDISGYIDTEIEELEKKTDSNLDFWGSAANWFGKAQDSGYVAPEQVNQIVTTFTDMINVVGTTVIVIATIVLGIRYIIGSVESQTAAKESLITLFIACIFFFGWTAISNLLYGGSQMNFIFTSKVDLTYKDMVGRIFSTFSYIAQFVVVGSIIYVGIKYIFAGASGRAELKGKSVYFIIGIIFVFATSNVLEFISKIINEAI